MNLVTEVKQKAMALSPRERHILSLAAQGFADKEIAVKIGISMGTVRTYWQRMRDKLNAHSRSEILTYCMQERHTESIAALEGSRDRLLAAFHGAAVGIALLNCDDEVLEANAAFAKHLGVTPRDLVGSKYPRPRSGPWTSEAGRNLIHHEVKYRGEACWVVTLAPTAN